MSPERCSWANHSKLEAHYHDTEWGVPVHDDKELFERLLLETMQAGLSWHTILQKREGFRNAFDDFDYHKIAQYDEAKIQSLLQDAGIVRNRLKIRAAVKNAQATLAIQEELGTLDTYFWRFVDFQPIIGNYTHAEEIQAKTDLSDTISRDMKKRGFSFTGSTTIYAFMQSIGMVDDHIASCFCRAKH